MSETIEAEVIEIDGKAPEPIPQEQGSSGSRSERARPMVLKLDRRWWPLWLVLGVVAVALIGTLGLVFGAVYLVSSLIRGVVRAFRG